MLKKVYNCINNQGLGLLISCYLFLLVVIVVSGASSVWDSSVKTASS